MSQAGIVPAPNQSALFMLLRVKDPDTNAGAVAQVAAGIPSLVDTVATNDQSAALVCNVGFGSGFWDMISPAKRPAGLRPFTAIDAGGRTAPSTGGDVLVHIISKRQDLNFELATQITNRLGDSVEVMDEVHGFRYFDSRDLTGFIDGTENPEGDEDRARVALIGDWDANFASGSYVFAQRYRA